MADAGTLCAGAALVLPDDEVLPEDEAPPAVHAVRTVAPVAASTATEAITDRALRGIDMRTILPHHVNRPAPIRAGPR
jgi:hypothetical protein